MPRENDEQLFTLMPMKTPSQDISTTLVAAFDSKVAGKCSFILRIYSIQKIISLRSVHRGL
ncbi:predicted protein [Botrytis cinerea T4]|uniref:Uncharacterized protein n=1 Tax=Botryotinia fuckeliana (strain T4) TaxID=999810 RepID=G2YFX3_BOTF4|nr:predicted protein [Botrytis cinerea T4]